MQIVDREKLLNGPKEPTPDNLRYPVIGQLDMLPLNGAHSVIPLGKMKIAEFAKDMAGGVRDIDHDRRRGAGERVPGRRDAPDGVVRGRDGGIAADGGVELQRSRGERAISARAAGASARIRRTRARRRCSTRRSPSSPGSTPACAPSTSAIRTRRRRSATSFRRSPRRPTQRCIKVDGQDRCKTAIQSNNVETDDRGYIYVVDRANTGMHILEVTGDARSIAGLQ